MFWITLPSILTVMQTCGACVIIIAIVASAVVLSWVVIAFAIGTITDIWKEFIR